ARRAEPHPPSRSLLRQSRASARPRPSARGKRRDPNPLRAERRLTRRPPPAEDGELERLEIAIDIGEADVAEPFALALERSENVRVFVRAMDVLVGDLGARLPRPLFRLKRMERVDEVLVRYRLDPRRRGRHMLHVDEHPPFDEE